MAPCHPPRGRSADTTTAYSNSFRRAATSSSRRNTECRRRPLAVGSQLHQSKSCRSMCLISMHPAAAPTDPASPPNPNTGSDPAIGDRRFQSHRFLLQRNQACRWPRQTAIDACDRAHTFPSLYQDRAASDRSFASSLPMSEFLAVHALPRAQSRKTEET